METGMEILQGINGKEDPFALMLPSMLDIGIMGSCKNRCEFCYQGHREQPHMTLINFKRLIDQVKHHTNQVALGGRGDPNNHPYFKQIIEYCRKNHVVPNYTTSGIDLTDEQIEISKGCGAVAVSDYERDFTYKSLQRLIDAGIRTNIHMIFDRQSYFKAMKIIYGYNPWRFTNNSYHEASFEYTKLNAVIFLLFKRAGAALDLENEPTDYQLQTFGELVFNPKSVFKIGMDSCMANHILKYSNPHPIQRLAIDTCEAARMSGYVTPDMKFMPCSFANEDDYAIPIKSGRKVYDIWNKSRPFKRFRTMLKKNPDKCPLNL